MVVAKSENAYTALKRAFKERSVDKVYHAVVQGLPDPLQGTIDASGRQEFLGAQDAEQVALLSANEVLAALTPGQGEVRDGDMPRIGQIRK